MTPPIVISTDAGQVNARFTRGYYEMGHFTKVVRRGAKRIGSNMLGALQNVAFENPDRS